MLAPREGFCESNSGQHYLWRAVDHEGDVPECFVTKRRDRTAAPQILKKAMKWYAQPEGASSPANCVLTVPRRRSSGRWQGKRPDVGRATGQRAYIYLCDERTSHAPLSPSAKSAEICFYPRFHFPSLQSGPQPFARRVFLAKPYRCFCWVG